MSKPWKEGRGQKVIGIDCEMHFLQSLQKFNPQIYLGPAYPLTPPYRSSPTGPAFPTRLRLQMDLPETHTMNTPNTISRP